MAAGGPGDNPMSDLLIWGLHPFTPDIEAMILRVRDISPHYLNKIDPGDYFDWKNGKNLDSGRERLSLLLGLAQSDLKRLDSN